MVNIIIDEFMAGVVGVGSLRYSGSELPNVLSEVGSSVIPSSSRRYL